VGKLEPDTLKLSSIPWKETQAGMNEAAGRSFSKADKRLAQLVAQQAKGLDATGKAKLEASQKAFFAYREAQARFEADFEARGGSMAPMIASGTAESLTEERLGVLDPKLRKTVRKEAPLKSLTQSGMNAEMFQRAQRSEAHLNVTLGKLRGQLDPQGQQLLDASQGAWSTYQKAAAEYGADEARGGSMAPGIYASVLNDLTKDRNAALLQLLKITR